MEKRNTGTTGNSMKKIIVTGPESTGKTTLAEQLSRSFNTIWVPEYAREYVENLDRPYDYKDLENIGRKQVEELSHSYPDAQSFVFFDTGLIITRTWFLECYQNCPSFIDQAIREIKVDMYLLCRPDIEWIVDPVRENKDLNRERLFSLYEEQLIQYGASYCIIDGVGEKRLNNAIQAVGELT
jgi:NadR type nicotinamide-nucleotide adenylyltransferase